MPRKGDSSFGHRKRVRYRRIKKKKKKKRKKSVKDRVSYELGDKHVLLPGPLRFVMQCFRNFSLSHVADDQTSRCKTSLSDFKFVARVAPPTALVLGEGEIVSSRHKSVLEGLKILNKLRIREFFLANLCEVVGWCNCKNLDEF